MHKLFLCYNWESVSKVTDEQIARAARIAQAAPFIEAYEEGYDYTLDAKGANISGFEKIANAMLAQGWY